MKNKLSDLNNHLFEMLERLNDDDLTDEQLDKEIKRAGAISNVSKQIIDNAKLEVEATKLMLDYSRTPQDVKLPTMIDYAENKTNNR